MTLTVYKWRGEEEDGCQTPEAIDSLSAIYYQTIVLVLLCDVDFRPDFNVQHIHRKTSEVNELYLVCIPSKQIRLWKFDQQFTTDASFVLKQHNVALMR